LDTRLRSVSRRKSTKISAFILTVVLITTGVLIIQYLACTGGEIESLFIEKYVDSNHFYHNHIMPARSMILFFIQNKDKIKNPPQDLEYYYYVRDGEAEFTNIPEDKKEILAQLDEEYFSFDGGNFIQDESTDEKYFYHLEKDDEYALLLAFPNEYINLHQEKWESLREGIIPFVVISAVCFLVSFGLIAYLIAVAGRKDEDDNLHLWRIDKTYSEILVILFGTILGTWIVIGVDLFNNNFDLTEELELTQIYSLIIYGVITIASVALMGLLFLSMVRKIKASMFLKQSIIYTVYFSIKDFLKSFFDGRRFERFPLTKALFYRQMIFIIVSGILVFLTFLFILIPPLMIIPPIIEIAVIYWYVKYNNKTYEEINKGFDESLQEQMKSERMKVELITNVSHDLKTPLTSIISYIELLAKEEGLTETARDYVNILSEKAYRLKNIVSDLFDLAKSTSGDIKLDLEKLDLKKLIEQTLGDMEDDILASGLQIKTRLPETPVYITSDGKKLYRVFQNLIDNALKYSLKGTRVYIDLEEIDGKAVVSIKNISAYEMDFTAEEILQRFTRGDKARSTEGSGLGLSIAESFTKVCGGEFQLHIDGDLFKVVLRFNVEK
jgi:signal transduction histidine kinase